MIVFIDLTGQIYVDDAEQLSFAFFDTVTGKFCEFSDDQCWDSVEDFISDYDHSIDIKRFLDIVPDKFKTND